MSIVLYGNMHDFFPSNLKCHKSHYDALKMHCDSTPWTGTQVADHS